MRYTKRFLSFFLSLTLLIPLLTIRATAATPFTDISDSAYYDAIDYVYNNGIMNGMTSTTFSPGVSISRGMIVTILYRLSGSNEEIDPVRFSDVPEDSYYYPIGWAQDNQIATGFEDGTFRPNDAITKEQFVTFLYRYTTEYENLSFTLPYSSLPNSLSDYSSIQPYARPAVNWAMNVGILAADFTYFYPANNVSRGLGAGCSIGFTTPIRAYEDDDGIHQFNLLVFNYLNQGYAIDAAIEKAGAGFTSAQKDYFGISSLQQYGDY